MKMEKFEYKYLDGPVGSSEELVDKKTGNCRFAVQIFYYKYFGRFLGPEEILLPEAYREVGEFVFQEEHVDFDRLKVGDIIYAKKRFGKDGNDILKSKEYYESEDEWILYSHTAVFLGKVDGKIKELFGDLPENKLLIWHVTSYTGKSCVWTVDEFVEKYEVMAVKRMTV